MGVYGGYRLAAGAAMPPLLLEDDEPVTLAIALRLTAGQPVAGLEESAVRALTKVLQVMPPRLRHRAKAVAIATVSATPLEGVIDPEALTALASAAANGERVRFDYADWQDRTTTRQVEPMRLVALSRRWYLVAFDLDRTDWRTFRADRIVEPHATGARAAHRELPGDVHTYLAEARAAMAPVVAGTSSLTSASPTPRPGSVTASATGAPSPAGRAARGGGRTPTPCHGSPHRSCTWAASSKSPDRPSCPDTSADSPTGSCARSRSDVAASCQTTYR